MAGLDKSGFTPLSLTENQDAIQQKLQERFGGTTLDLSSQSVLGQLVGILSNSYADLWAMGQALYANSYPAGASGVGVDNILAVNNLQRLTAKATVTSPVVTRDESGFLKYGFVCTGSPGTVVPAGTLVSNGAASPATFATDAAITIGFAANGSQTLAFSNQPSQGAYTLDFVSPGGDTLTTKPIPWNAQANITTLAWTKSNNAIYGSSWKLVLGTQTTDTIVSQEERNNLSAATIQNAINGITAYRNVTVTGSVGSGFQIFWGSVAVPVVSASGQEAPDTVIQSVSSFVHNLANASNLFPFTDVQVVGQASALQFNFGAYTATQGMPASSAQAIRPILVSSNTLTTGSVSTSLVVSTQAQGNPAFGSGAATCIQAGATTILANQLNTIVTPVAGLVSCNNELDCVTGRDVESDSDAISRLRSVQGSAASGSLAAIIKKLNALANVTQVVGSQNTSSAAQQVIVFSGAAASGSYSLKLGTQTTETLSFDAGAAKVQTAINALAGFEDVRVSPYGTSGFVLDFGGAAGRQSQPLCVVTSNTTGVPITPFFGRAPHSVELVVQGGDDQAIAQTILDTLPAGIGTYSNPEARTLGSITAGQASLIVASAKNITVGQTIQGSGIPLGTTVASVTGTTVTMSASAIATASSVPVAFDHEILLSDAAGNALSIGFSRPVSTVIFISLKLTTDRFLTPGDKTSGSNPASRFSTASIPSIQSALLAVVNQTPIGGLLIANGSNGLGGSFRSVAGIVDYELRFDRVSPPQNQANLQLASNEAPLAESFYTEIAYDV